MSPHRWPSTREASTSRLEPTPSVDASYYQADTPTQVLTRPVPAPRTARAFSSVRTCCSVPSYRWSGDEEKGSNRLGMIGALTLLNADFYEGVQAARLVLGEDDEVHPGHGGWLRRWAEAPVGADGVAESPRRLGESEPGSRESRLERVAESLEPFVADELAVSVVEMNVLVEVRFERFAPNGDISRGLPRLRSWRRQEVRARSQWSCPRVVRPWRRRRRVILERTRGIGKR